MAKKKVSPQKKKAARKPARKPARKVAGRPKKIDTKPLQEQIRKRIEDLRQGVTAARTGTTDDTISRLQIALETLKEICYPAMDVSL